MLFKKRDYKNQTTYLMIKKVHCFFFSLYFGKYNV